MVGNADAVLFGVGCFCFGVVLHVAQRVVGEHVLGHPLVGFLGGHLPARRASADNLDKRGAFLGLGIEEGFLEGCLRLAHGGGGVDGLTGHVACAVEQADHIGYLEGEAVEVVAAAVGGGGCLGALEGGGRHLSAGHAKAMAE